MGIKAKYIYEPGLIVFGILGGISMVMYFIYLIVMAMAQHVPDSAKYTEMKYQEYLIKNPKCELCIGDKQLTAYKNEKFNIPFVVTLKTSGGQKYEAFVDSGGGVELIGDKLLVSHSGG